jgi:hypothetical protein
MTVTPHWGLAVVPSPIAGLGMELPYLEIEELETAGSFHIEIFSPGAAQALHIVYRIPNTGPFPTKYALLGWAEAIFRKLLVILTYYFTAPCGSRLVSDDAF